MFKKTFVSLTLFFTIFCYAQKSTLHENVNYRAKELKQSLSKNGDSLILQGERNIYKVEIYNSNFERTINVDSTKVKIAINDLPIGKYIVDATLINKHIIMTLFRDQVDYDLPKDTKTIAVVDSINVTTTKKPNTKQPLIDRHAQILSKRLAQSKPKTHKYYWVMHKIDNGSASRKLMRLENHEEVEKLIEKHQLEIRTQNGKHNKLTIWEVYDRVNFMKLQVANPEYINSSTSGLFNVNPYYTSLVK